MNITQEQYDADIQAAKAQALRDAADDYEAAMDDDTMHTSTWEFLRARADGFEV